MVPSPKTPSSEVVVTDDLELLLAVMPSEIRDALAEESSREALLEIVLDLGRIPEARYTGRTVDLLSRTITGDDLAHVLDRVGRFGDDNRAGIGGTLHRISALRNRVGDVVGLTCRVGRAVFGTVDILRDTIEEGRSILLLGRPGVGKTTLLREAARVLAQELGKRVVVVDTSNEIAGDGDVPHPGIGRARRMQVPSPSSQHAVMIEAVENHMPEVIVIDEIGTSAEALAARTIAERGVQLIATAHGNTLENLLRNPTLCDLVGGIHTVTLSDEEARRRGSQKSVLERKAPPTFDVVVEIQDKDRLAIHHRVADVVDRLLRGGSLPPELRSRTKDGKVEIEREERPAESGADERRERPMVAPRQLRRRLRIYPYAVARQKLERAIRLLNLPATLVLQPRDADVVLTVKGQQRKQASRWQELEKSGIRLAVIRSNTSAQLESFLRGEFGLEEPADEFQEALREAEDAIDQVMNGGAPVELAARERHVRRVQHELVERAGLVSQSRGQEPFRRLVVFPS